MTQRISVFLIALQFFASAIASDQPPEVLLIGMGANEAAPHGQGNIYAPSVLFDAGKWRMWYGGQGRDGHDRISYAESNDRKVWSRIGVVLEDNSANHINDPCVVLVRDKLFMFYTRAEKHVIDRIHVATSEDGIHWTKGGMVLDAGPAGAWDSLSVGRPAVIFDEGVFKLWYDGRKDFPQGTPVAGVPISANSHRYVGYATSKDDLIFHRHQEDPVFGNDAGGIDVQRLGNGYVLLYESHGGTRHARSRDGIEWKEVGWLVEKSGTDVDLNGHVTPFLLVDQKKNSLLFFGAARTATWDHNSIAVVPVRIDDSR